MLHLVRFHCISGEVKVVEGSDFRDMVLYWHGNWQATTGGGRPASPYGTTHSLLNTIVTMVM